MATITIVIDDSGGGGKSRKSGDVDNYLRVRLQSYGFILPVLGRSDSSSDRATCCLL